jgi:hypothetical protein
MRFNQNHDTSDAIDQIVASAAVWMTWRTRYLTTESDLCKPLRAFRSARTRKTTKVSNGAYIRRRRRCGLHDMRQSAIVCDVYQTIVVEYLYDWGLDNVNRGSSVQHEKTTHYVLQAEIMVTIPNTKATIEKNMGVRLWTRLFVRP